jgi:hypothetical protein
MSWAGVAVALAVFAGAIYFAEEENAPSPGAAPALATGTSAPVRPVTAPGESTGARAIPLGDYAGLANPAGIQAFGSATTTHPVLATDYLDRGHGWTGLDSATNVKAWSSTTYKLVLGVPILPDTGTLARGASGAYDTYFVTLARTLVNDGEATAVLRLGWEFNGTWFRWSARTATDAGDYAAYWRQIVTAMRSVPGERFRFLWNPNAASPTGYAPDAAYPGDAYVDYVGTDVYDDSFGPPPRTEATAWANQLSQQWGLDWLASFAARHRRPIAIPEWSVDHRADGHGLGDDPAFIDHMASWLVADNVAFADVWSYDSSPRYRNNLLDGSFPHALAAFEADFG